MPTEQSRYTIYYDSLHEGQWLRHLDSRLRKTLLKPFPERTSANLAAVLKYDRPDVVLCDSDTPILVIERSEEVPTGHNVGQRFGRLVAAAEARVPCLYFYPFAARKHGGETAGPRYLNLRLLSALSRLESIHKSLQLSICWPVDADCELIRGEKKDANIRAVVRDFLDAYEAQGRLPTVEMLEGLASVRLARQAIAAEEKRMLTANPEYQTPPGSVRIVESTSVTNPRLLKILDTSRGEVVFYDIGMTYVRSDPYTGMAMLYDYLYGRENDGRIVRNLVLNLFALERDTWNRVLAKNADRKDVRIYTQTANAILFKDGDATRGGRG